MERREFVENRPGWREEYGSYVSKLGFFGGQAAFLSEYLPVTTEPLRLLDIGCAYGMFMKYLRTQNSRLEVFGIEVARDAAEQAMREAGAPERVAWQGCGDPFPFPSDHFDGVVCFDVIEHVADSAALRRMVSETARVLKPGGYAFIETPNYNRRMQWLHRLTGQGHMLKYDHCNLFGERRLTELVADSLELVGIVHRGGVWFGPRLPDARLLWPRRYISSHICAVGRKSQR